MPTILIIDDDVALLARLGSQLEEAGYTVLRASEVRHAELVIAEQPLDMILLDTDTSRGAGWALLERVAPQLPVIVISGQALEEDVIRGLEAGAIDYMSKPFRSGELLARLRIRLRGAATEAQQPAQVEPSTSDTLRLAPPLDAPQAEAEAAPISPPPPAERPPSRATGRRRRADEAEEPVFIPYSEEQRLLNQHSPLNDEALSPAEATQLSLGRRLHAARQHKRISLVQAELESKLRMHYIQAMEEEKFSLLPRGPVAEELLRTYATYIGVDVGQALDEYRRLHYSTPIEPPPALGGTAAPRTLPGWTIRLLAVILALLVGLGGIWLLDPTGVTALAGRARMLVAPPTATPAPTATAQPTVTIAPTARPTATNTPLPTAPPTITPQPSPTSTPLPSDTPTPTVRR